MAYDFLGRIIERHVSLGLTRVDRLREDRGEPLLATLTDLADQRAADATYDLYLELVNANNAAVHYRIGLVSGTVYQGALPPGTPVEHPTVPPGPIAVRFTRDPEGALLAISGDHAPDLFDGLLLPSWRKAALDHGLPVPPAPVEEAA